MKRGLTQGYVLSPDMLSLYYQAGRNELLDKEGIRIGCTNINSIRLTDDTVLIADTEEKLKSLLVGLEEACERYGLKINIRKTELIIVTKRSKPLTVGKSLGGVILKRVNSCKYLRSLVDEHARKVCDIRAGIGMEKGLFGKLKKILVNLSMGRATIVKVLKSMLWSVMFFGREAWMITKKMR